jgi:hypothetical protein
MAKRIICRISPELYARLKDIQLRMKNETGLTISMVEAGQILARRKKSSNSGRVDFSLA